MIWTEYVFIVILSLICTVLGGFCRSVYGYPSRYCYYGCCGTWPNESCCGVYGWIIAVAVIGGIVGLIAIVVCIVCVVQKQHGRRGRIIDPVGPTVQVTTYQSPGALMYQPTHYQPQQSYNPLQTNQQQYPLGGSSMYPPPPPPATYNQVPAYPPPKYQQNASS